jgi:PKD repeat protein/cephalosporin-C deacetylase-like acetyl esterase
MRIRALALTSLLLSTEAFATDKPTDAQIADFWARVFMSVPPLNATRGAPRTVGNTTVWTVNFDSYKDPDGTQPVRLQGFLAIPNNITPPGPGGKFPGLISTHSVGQVPPAEGEATAVYFAQRGFAALSFYFRGYGGSPLMQLNPATPGCQNFWCAKLAPDGQEPLNSPCTGVAVDMYQAAEFLAAQPEVWNPSELAFIGHSGGGFAGLLGAVFNPRYRVLAISAAAFSTPDPDGWIRFWTGSSFEQWVAGFGAQQYGSAATAQATLTRTWTFNGTYQAINNPALVLKNAAWRIDNTEIFLYGGQADPAVPPADVQATYLKLDASNNKALHWSPTGAHGGPESFNRTRAWIDGHYTGRATSPPQARLSVVSNDGGTVTFSGAASTDNDVLVAYDWEPGDGTWRNWGDTLAYSYADAGTYTAKLTVTDGSGLRSSAMTTVTVGSGGGNAQISLLTVQPVRVPEGGTASFTVGLTRQPPSNVTLSIARTSGDIDITLVGASSHVIAPANWNQPLTLNLAAAQDADRASSPATFTLSLTNAPSVALAAVEADDDARFTISVGSATAAAGNRAIFPVTLANPDQAFINSFAFTVAAPPALLARSDVTRGPSVPGPAWWNFSAMSSAAGAHSVSAQEFAMYTGSVEGVVANLELDLASGAAPGTYPVTLSAASVTGTAPTTVDGVLTIVASVADAGEPDAGQTPPDAGQEQPDAGAVLPDAGSSADGGDTPPVVPRGCGCDAAGSLAGPLLLIGVALTTRKRRRSEGSAAPAGRGE